MTTFAHSVVDFYYNLDVSEWRLPESISLLNPFEHHEARPYFEAFYHKYFDDSHQRRLILGINPGRFGAGITGISFTDPKILAEQCDIPNPMHKRYELSAIFIYEMIAALGGIESFYKQFYISSVAPLGFVKEGKNINYYDDKALQDSLKPYICQALLEQIKFGLKTDKVFVLGQGKNYKYLKKLNDEIQLFDEVIPLPHPRWVMQYRRKMKDDYIEEFRKKLIV